jgi:hypothetical protein
MSINSGQKTELPGKDRAKIEQISASRIQSQQSIWDVSMATLMPMSEQSARPSAFEFFWRQFGRVNVGVGGGISMIVAVLIWKFLPDRPVPLWLIALVGLPTLMVLVSLVMGLREAAHMVAEKPQSNIVAVVPPCAPFARSQCILIVEWSTSAALAVGSGVTISLAEQHHERALGIGTVRQVQANGKAQVTIDTVYAGSEETLRRLLEPSGAELVKNLRLGAQVQLQYIPGMPSPTGQSATTVSSAEDQLPSPPSDPDVASKGRA